jgi:hypothetical protein
MIIAENVINTKGVFILSSNHIELSDRAHFRRVREVISEIAEYEGININNYDLYNIRAYDTHGENLKGKNVTYNTEGNYSCWVLDNRYDMFEVSSKSNKKGSSYGNFIFFSFNQGFQYFQFGLLDVHLDVEETKHSRFITEKVHYKPYGKYNITFEGDVNHITKVEYGHKFTPGNRSNEHSFVFDSYNSRKLRGYKLSQYDIFKSIGISNTDSEKLVGKSPVPIYRKTK